MKSCVVIFPLYKRPTSIELSFLENGMQQTQGFKQVIAAPAGLVVDRTFGQLEKLEVKRFSSQYFDGIKGYNQLLLSRDFYQAFALFDYILIHQADVFLFKDELQLWCEKEYDYIGAPWFRPDKLHPDFVSKQMEKIKFALKKNKIYASRHNKSGNGGLSLRNVQTALKVLKSVQPALLKKYLVTDYPEYNEDIFWSLEAPAIYPAYRIPALHEALQFAVEFEPAAAYQHLDGQLPFGCHAPMKHDPAFWKKFIPILNRNESRN